MEVAHSDYQKEFIKAQEWHAAHKAYEKLPRRVRDLEDMARATRILRKFYEAGYTDLHLFKNAMIAVIPKYATKPDNCFELAMYHDLLDCPWYISLDAEKVFEILNPTLL